MGVESKFYILSDSSGYHPDAVSVCQLVRALRAAGFVCDPMSPTFAESAHRTGNLSSPATYEGFFGRGLAVRGNIPAR